MNQRHKSEPQGVLTYSCKPGRHKAALYAGKDSYETASKWRAALQEKRAEGPYQTQSAIKMFVSPRTLLFRLEAKTSLAPSWLNIGKPSKVGL